MSRKKHTYWHQLAKLLILNGYKPAQSAKVLKEVFPETDINGRHIGAYKRRLIKEEDIIVPTYRSIIKFLPDEYKTNKLLMPVIFTDSPKIESIDKKKITNI